jgi:hypothetical protein
MLKEGLAEAEIAWKTRFPSGLSGGVPLARSESGIGFAIT